MPARGGWLLCCSGVVDGLHAVRASGGLFDAGSKMPGAHCVLSVRALDMGSSVIIAFVAGEADPASVRTIRVSDRAFEVGAWSSAKAVEVNPAITANAERNFVI